MISKYYLQFYNDDRTYHALTQVGKWPFSLIQEARKAWVEYHTGNIREIKNRDGPHNGNITQEEYKTLKEISQRIDMISIIQRTNGIVQLNFPYSKYENNIPDGMVEWLIENTEQKWTYGKWQMGDEAKRIGIEITKEDLVALKLKFSL
jgi:hypothetical protein